MTDSASSSQAAAESPAVPSTEGPSVWTAALIGLGALVSLARALRQPRPNCPLAHLFVAAPTLRDALFLRGRVPRLRGSEGPAASDRRGVRRRHRPVVLHPGADAADPGGDPRVRRHRAGGPARGRHAVLLLLGGPPLPRVRHGRGAARRDVLLPDLGADGERGGSRPAVRALRLEGGADLHDDGARHRDGVRLDRSDVSEWRTSSSPGSGRSGAERAPSADKVLRWSGPDSVRPRGASRHRRERSGSTSSPASPSGPPSTGGFRRISWRRSWARRSGGRCRSSS